MGSCQPRWGPGDPDSLDHPKWHLWPPRPPGVAGGSSGGLGPQQGYLGGCSGPASCVVGAIAGASRRVFRRLFQVFYRCAGIIGRGPRTTRTAVQTRPGPSSCVVLAPPRVSGVVVKVSLVPGGSTRGAFWQAPPWLVVPCAAKRPSRMHGTVSGLAQCPRHTRTRWGRRSGPSGSSCAMIATSVSPT